MAINQNITENKEDRICEILQSLIDTRGPDSVVADRKVTETKIIDIVILREFRND